jgi:tRNA A37 threonylcarbamoyladenosine synthetase subunit TsaC/SUA5/YrdC
MKSNAETSVMKAVVLLCQRDFIVIPDSEGYIIACNALDEGAVSNLRQAAHIEPNIALTVLLASPERLGKYAHESEPALKLLSRSFSGKIGFLLEPRFHIKESVRASEGRIEFAIPSSPLLLDVLSRIQFPMAIARVTGDPGMLNMNLPFVFTCEGHDTEARPTLIEFGDGQILMHRNGPISSSEIEKVTGIPVVRSLNPIFPEKGKSLVAVI